MRVSSPRIITALWWLTVFALSAIAALVWLAFILSASGELVD